MTKPTITPAPAQAGPGPGVPSRPLDRSDPTQNARYCKEWHADVYRNGKRRVPAGPAAARCLHWVNEGWSHRQIAAACGVSCTRITRLLAGTHKTTHRDIEARILAADLKAITAPGKTYVPAVGTRRRLQGLYSMGHGRDAVAKSLRMSRNGLSLITTGQASTVQAKTALAVGDLYRRWCTVPGTSSKSRAYARRRGWVGPAAWGADIDDPAAVPEPEPSPAGDWLDHVAVERLVAGQALGFSSHAERKAAARFLVEVHELPQREAAAMVGVSDRTVLRWKQAGWGEAA